MSSHLSSVAEINLRAKMNILTEFDEIEFYAKFEINSYLLRHSKLDLKDFRNEFSAPKSVYLEYLVVPFGWIDQKINKIEIEHFSYF